MKGCSFHTINQPNCLYCREALTYEDTRTDWIDRCPFCSNSDIRTTETATETYKWCGHCGRNNK